MQDDSISNATRRLTTGHTKDQLVYITAYKKTKHMKYKDMMQYRTWQRIGFKDTADSQM